jgi:hypothetical protein
VYRDAANASGAHTLTVSTSDGTLTATDTVAIDVNPVNDAPVIAMALLDENFDGENGGSSAAQYINFANWIPNDFTDLIGTGSNQNFYPGNGLYVDLAGSNSGPATLTSRTEYSAGLYTLKFEIAGPHRDSVGHNVSSGGETDTVRVTFGDYSEDFYLDTGATLSVTRQVTLDAAASLSIGSLGGPVNPNIGAILFGASVSKVDAAPTISYVEGQAAQAINAVLTLSDLDNATFSGATVQITGNFHAAEDSLVFANQNGITGSYDSSLGVLILTGVASVAAYQAALRSVAYANSSDDPSTGARTIGFQVDDGGDANNLSAVVSATVNVTAVNDAPVAHNDAATTSLNALLTVAAASGLLANDTDPDSADTLTVTQINGQHFSEGNAIDLAHGTLTVATDGSYSFQPTQGFSGTQTFDYTVSDGHVTDTATATLTVDNNYVLTFDDTAGGLGSFLPGGYGGLTWSNIYVLSGDLYAPRSGYAHGTVSDPNVAYNGNGTPAIVSGDEFNFVGADLTAAWNTGLSIQVDGFHEGSRIYSQTVTVDYSAPTWFAFNYTNIDHLVFLSSGGTWADLGGSGTHFAMDNFTWSPVGADPIILDLGAPGISLTPVPVAFDLNADGVKESIGWTSGEDGILVSDLDHSGSIENGHEVFSPVFGTAGFADALAALASLDGNRDGVIDARDASFRDIAVWQDANHDGVSQQGELGSLSDHGIVSLDLNAEPVAEQNGGQEVVALGHVTLSTGATSEYIAVNLQGVPGATVGIGDQSGASTGGAISTAGGDAPVEGDTFHFAPGIGAVTVSHFNVASDTIVLEGYDFVANYDDLFTALESNGDAFHGDAVIDLGNGDSITVAGVSQSYLQQHLDLVHVGSGLV